MRIGHRQHASLKGFFAGEGEILPQARQWRSLACQGDVFLFEWSMGSVAEKGGHGASRTRFSQMSKGLMALYRRHFLPEVLAGPEEGPPSWREPGPHLRFWDCALVGVIARFVSRITLGRDGDPGKLALPMHGFLLDRDSVVGRSCVQRRPNASCNLRSGRCGTTPGARHT